MRDITSATLNSTSIKPIINLEFALPDSSWTAVHCNEDILDMTPIAWQIPFGGGEGKPGNYDVTLSLSLDTIKANLSNYTKANARLKLILGDSTIQPHVGKVRGIKRTPGDPNQLKLTIVDRFFDDDPAIPREMMADSFSGLHLEEINAAYPLYYGFSHRPFYHTAVDCDISTLLGPRSVSSENHVNSVWFNEGFTEGDLITENNVILMHVNGWIQENSGNTITGTTSGGPFRIEDNSGDTRLWDYGTLISTTSGSNNTVGNFYKNIANFTNTRFNSNIVKYGFNINANLKFKAIKSLNGTIKAVTTSLGLVVGDHFLNSSSGETSIRIILGSTLMSGGPTSWNFSFSIDTSITFPFCTEFSVKLFSDMAESGKRNSFDIHISGTKNNVISMQSIYNFGGQLDSVNYKKYSIFSPVINSSDLAISKNPVGILDDLFTNHSSYEFRQDQSSAAQLIINSFQFQCFFPIQEKLTDIADEFGKIAGFYTWIGDSGMINCRAYQESGTVAVDRTLTFQDYSNLDLNERPIETTLNNQSLASKINANYAFDFQLNRTVETKRAWPGNAALCNSLDALGITKTLNAKTKYITDPNVASLWIGNLVRFHAQGNEFVSIVGGANLFDIELTDVLNIQNAILVGSEGLYQVIKTKMNVLQGTMEVTTAKLLSTNPT